MSSVNRRACRRRHPSAKLSSRRCGLGDDGSLAVVEMACSVWETRGKRLQTETGSTACALLLQSSQQAEDLQASKAEAAGLHAQLASAQVCVRVRV